MLSYLRYLKLHTAAQPELVYLRSERDIHHVSDSQSELGLAVREENALKFRALVAYAEAQMLSAADGRYFLKARTDNAQCGLGISAAVWLEPRERIDALHVQHPGVCYLHVAAQCRKLRGLIMLIIFAERAAELPELITLYIKSGRERVTAEAFEIFRAGRQRIEKVKAAVAPA